MSNQLSLKDIFVGGFIKPVHFTNYGNNKCLKYLIEQIKFEHEGIDIDTPNGIVKVHFILGLILGDNLGINRVCEFRKSFSVNYFCRFCRENKVATQSQVRENSNF